MGGAHVDVRGVEVAADHSVVNSDRRVIITQILVTLCKVEVIVGSAGSRVGRSITVEQENVAELMLYLDADENSRSV